MSVQFKMTLIVTLAFTFSTLCLQCSVPFTQIGLCNLTSGVFGYPLLLISSSPMKPNSDTTGGERRREEEGRGEEGEEKRERREEIAEEGGERCERESGMHCLSDRL